MNEVKIKESDEKVFVITDDGTYDIRRDPHTGDWGVTFIADIDDPSPAYYFTSRSGAINYALESAGAVQEATYQKAPDRTSA